VFLKNTSETISFGKDFVSKLKPKSILILKGPIGAGKTSFVQGIGEGLCIKESITSPTFALSHHYESGSMHLIHMDLYRIENSISAKELFIEEEEELETTNGLLIIEWPELIEPFLEIYWKIEINYAYQDGRNVNIYEPTSSKNL
tara:strand:- start:2111 stop:2545 length:435 start_codon:yes stop_codon:yes gene_type:complete